MEVLMVLLGQCNEVMWKCPQCRQIYGGVVEGIEKRCVWCPHRSLCTPREELINTEYLCGKQRCTVESTFESAFGLLNMLGLIVDEHFEKNRGR